MIAPQQKSRSDGEHNGHIPKVSFLQRKPRPKQNFSIEFIFDDLRHRLSGDIRPTVHRAPFYSNGVIRRALIALSAALHQGELNHVTGDIHFASLLLRRRKTLLTIHDLGVLNDKRGLRKALLKWLWFQLPATSSRLITTVSETTKREVLKQIDVPPEKIRVIPNAVSSCFHFSPKPFNEECPRILQVGTKPNKNLSRLIPALSGISCKLQIIGPLTDSLRTQLDASMISYENWSNLSLDEVIRKYQQCDLLTFCSTYEGFGMPIVEANVVGRPVVTSNISSMPEVAGNAACLVDPFNSESIHAGISRVIEDADYRSELIANGQTNAERFDANNIAEQYLAIYREMEATE